MDAQSATPARSPHGRLRWAMHGALALIALMLALAGASVWQAEGRRGADAELIGLAGGQQMLSQRLVLLADQAGDDGGQALDNALAQAQGDALRLEQLLQAYDTERLAALPAALGAAVGQWQATRERLWYRAQNLARLAGEAAGPDRLREARGPVRAEADAMLAATQALLEQVRAHAHDKAAQTLQRLASAGLIAALLLLGLAGAVVEPAARFVRRQHRRQAAQAAQLARLALVAERTHNVVVISDAQRRIVWANDAFSRVSGYTLAEAIGRKPADLLRDSGSDPALTQRMHAAFEAGQGVRLELQNRAKDGHAYWMDVDIQPLHDGVGRISGFIGVETEITEQVYQRQRLRALLDALPTGVIEHDASGAIVEANRAAEQALGLTRDQLLGLSPMDARWRTVHDDLSPYPGDEHPSARSIRDGLSVRGDSIGVVTPQGEQRWLLVNSEPLRNPHGATTGAVACFVDITEQRAQRMLLQLALRAAEIGTWEWRVDSGQRQWSEQSCALLGFSPAEMAPLLADWRTRIHPDDLDAAEALLRDHLRAPASPYRCDVRVRHRDGHWVWLQVYGSVVERDAAGRAQRMVGVHIDIGERKRHEQQLQARALTDTLTGLPNRAALMPRLRAAVAAWRQDAARHFGLLFLDFDRFKQVNDTLGHAAGDDLLRQIGARLQGALRQGRQDGPVGHDGERGGSALAVRLGGDEFVVLLADLPQPGDATVVAERLLAVLAQPYRVQGHTVHSSASIGVVSSAGPVEDAEGLLRDADAAMYRAKQRGHGSWAAFDAAEPAPPAPAAAGELQAALARDELFIVYQPMLALDGAPGGPACAGVEALVRWRHPEHGVVAPGQFIASAEAAGLIGALGRFVLRSACQQFMRWRLTLGEGAPALLAVNLSWAQLAQPDLVDQVAGALADAAMPAAALQLEVSEGQAAQDSSTQARLRALKALGVKLALDDFGTGWSALAGLQLLPVDAVKIDCSLVAEAERSDYHRALISAAVRVARTLCMHAVAEGIENPAQAELMRSLGCGLGQGFLFCRPLPADELTRWLAEGAAARAARPALPAPLQLVRG